MSNAGTGKKFIILRNSRAISRQTLCFHEDHLTIRRSAGIVFQMKKSARHNPEKELEIEHAFAYDLVREAKLPSHSRLYLFANAFSPNLGAKLLFPSEFVFFNITDSYREPLHIHGRCSEILLVLEGEYSCSVNARELTLKPMEGILIQKGDAHMDHCDKPGVFLGLSFYPIDSLGRAWDAEILKETDNIREHCFSIAGDTDLETLVTLARKQANSTEPFIRQANYAFSLMLLWRLLGKLETQLTREFLEMFSNNLFRLQVNHLFEENLKCPLPVAEMAEQLNMSRKALENNMMRLFDSSPAKAFLAFKMECAAQLLKAGRSSKEVTKELGFNNQFHFSRTFKAHFGVNATEFAK